MTRFAKNTTAVALVVLSIGSVTHAGVVPPPWLQGPNPDLTSPQTDQLWTFDNALAPTIPDFANNPNGTPHMATAAPYGQTQLGSGYGLGGPFGGLDFTIPNYGGAGPSDIWVTIKFSMILDSHLPQVAILGTDGSQGSLVQTLPITEVRSPIFEISYLYSLPSSSTFDLLVGVSPGALVATVIDQVYFATRSTPVPAPSVAGVCLLGAVMIGRRRR